MVRLPVRILKQLNLLLTEYTDGQNYTKSQPIPREFAPPGTASTLPQRKAIGKAKGRVLRLQEYNRGT